ncbi:hypothetical protein STAS_21301 [Striga asiatica]|uniref:DUF1639 family protein n=1 Tax=Striga asiatica TaxID=4170 RepID=A0A5A7QH41_STRAF|nr:hypothetical protein STAS_21301 [Striga asiatica]
MAMGTGRSSKALHNFTMPFELRWGNQKQMRCTKVNSSGHNPPPRRFSPHDSHRRRRREDSVQHPRVGSGEERGRESGSPSDFARGSYKSSRSPPHLAPGGDRRFSDGGDDGISAVREKLMFDLQTAAERMKDAVFRDGFVKGEASSSPPPPPPLPATPMEVEIHRPWNLRTRRAACKTPAATSDASLNAAATTASGETKEGPAGEKDLVAALKLRSGSSEMKVGESPATADRFLRMRSGGPSAIGKKGDRRRFAVALSKAEIEEDFYGIVGHRPARRPKKRARIVQRQLDTLFPGLWLKEVTADMYKIDEAAP